MGKFAEILLKGGLESTGRTVIVSTLLRLGLKGIEQSALALLRVSKSQRSRQYVNTPESRIREKKFKKLS